MDGYNRTEIPSMMMLVNISQNWPRNLFVMSGVMLGVLIAFLINDIIHYQVTENINLTTEKMIFLIQVSRSSIFCQQCADNALIAVHLSHIHVDFPSENSSSSIRWVSPWLC